MNPFLLLLVTYLIGAFPTSYLMGRLHGADLRREGSGNLGATNVYRLYGWPSGLFVVIFDVAKGFGPAWFFPLWDSSGSPEWALAYGLAAIAGHVWSIFTRFSGGKGVATAAGVLLALAPLAALIGAFVWLGLALITGYASLASLAASAVVPLVAYASAAPSSTVLYGFLLGSIIWFTHRRNLGRLLRREELPLTSTGRGRSDGHRHRHP